MIDNVGASQNWWPTRREEAYEDVWTGFRITFSETRSNREDQVDNDNIVDNDYNIHETSMLILLKIMGIETIARFITMKTHDTLLF